MTRIMPSKNTLTIPITISFGIHLTLIFMIILFYLYRPNYKIDPFFVRMIDPAILNGINTPAGIIPQKESSYRKDEMPSYKKGRTFKGDERTKSSMKNESSETPSLTDSINIGAGQGSSGIGKDMQIKDGIMENGSGSIIRDGLPFAGKGDLERYAKVEEYSKKRNNDPIKKNTEEFKYTAYFAKLKRRLEMIGSYPESAKSRRLQGEVGINFTILKDGKLGSLTLANSSGYRILDEDALTLLNDAAPFEPFPKEWENKELMIPLIVIYYVNYIYVL